MDIIVTKTAILETDPVTARVKAARLDAKLEEMEESALAFGYEYDEEDLKAYYELTGDEDAVNCLLVLLEEPCTDDEVRRCLRADRAAANKERAAALARTALANRRRIGLCVAAVCGLAAASLLLSEADEL